MPMLIYLPLSDARFAKLNALAKARSNSKRTLTPEQCLLDFIDTCQLGGSGWSPPDAPAKKPEPPATQEAAPPKPQKRAKS